MPGVRPFLTRWRRWERDFTMPLVFAVKSVPVGMTKVYTPRAGGVAGKFWTSTGQVAVAAPAVGSYFNAYRDTGVATPFVVNDTGECLFAGGARRYFIVTAVHAAYSGASATALVQGICPNTDCRR